MNPFAKELDLIIKRRQLANTKAGKLCNIDPSLLRRYRKGERIPRNDSILQKLNDGLDLSITEQNDLSYAYKVTKNAIEEEKINLDDISEIVNKKIDISDSSLISIVERVCEDTDFSRFEDKKMISIQNIEEIQSALSYVGAFAEETNSRVYVLSELLRKKEKQSPVIRFTVPGIRDTEQVIITNQFMDNYDLLISYIQHKGICNEGRKHDIYTYKTNGSINICDSWMYLSEQFVLKFEVYRDSVSGFLSFDTNVIQYYRDIYEKYRSNSRKYDGNQKIFSAIQ